jgi:predicted transcriptional regulator of viral defense system
MAKQLNWPLVEVERLLRQNNLPLFTPQDLQHLCGASEIALRFLLTRAVKRGDALKFRRGLYGLAARPPSELELANHLYVPSYLSFTFALSYYHLIPETVYTITSATTRTTATFTALGKSFVYHRIKRTAFTGYTPTPIHQRVVWIAEPEKAVVDTLYLVALGKHSLPERLDLTPLSRLKLHTFAQLFNHPKPEALLEQIL